MSAVTVSQNTLYSVLLSLFFRYVECQIIGLQLQPTTMPIDGSTWATYYEPLNRTIFLLSPLRCQTMTYGGCGFLTHIHGDIISYDIDRNTFAIHPSISNITDSMQSYAPRYAAAVGHNIYFNGDTDLSARIDVYNIKTGITTPNIKAINSKDGCLVTDGRFLFIVGGQTQNGGQGSWNFQIYDTTTDTWYSGDDQKYLPRRFPCEVINGVIYEFGGDNGNVMTQITKFNIGTGDTVLVNYNKMQWEDAGSLNIPRAKHNTAPCGNLIYIIGGYTTGFANALSIEIYDIITEETVTAPFTLNQARINPATMCIDQTIYVFGGRDDRDLNSGTTLNSWEKSIVTESPTALPTKAPTSQPSVSPTMITENPTRYPSLSPSKHPSVAPSGEPTLNPSSNPSSLPSMNPTITPTIHPTIAPTTDPISYNEGEVEDESTIAPIVSEEGDPNKEAQAETRIDFVLIALIVVVIFVCVLIMCFSVQTFRLHKESHKVQKEEDVLVMDNEEAPQSMRAMDVSGKHEMVVSDGTLVVEGPQTDTKGNECLADETEHMSDEDGLEIVAELDVIGNNEFITKGAESEQMSDGQDDMEMFTEIDVIGDDEFITEGAESERMSAEFVVIGDDEYITKRGSEEDHVDDDVDDREMIAEVDRIDVHATPTVGN
eukprot:286633_1